jgi:hypothetical protein
MAFNDVTRLDIRSTPARIRDPRPTSTPPPPPPPTPPPPPPPRRSRLIPRLIVLARRAVANAAWQHRRLKGATPFPFALALSQFFNPDITSETSREDASQSEIDLRNGLNRSPHRHAPRRSRFMNRGISTVISDASVVKCQILDGAARCNRRRSIGQLGED